MVNEQFTGTITSVSAGIKTNKLEDGTKVKIGVYKVKLASNDIDYESMAKFNASISSTLLNIQPIPFQSINFGDQSVYNMNLHLSGETEEDEFNRTVSEEIADEGDASFGHVMIKNLSVTVKEDIPTFVFSLEIPMVSEAKFLFTHLKTNIRFEFSKE
ncbi:MAG: hypothetical protein PF574_00145 [Candidatus Delongbacteria bacterium]|jgi:hypothetical protein|nr:hypothetical protein [Candidatus Delongbacteria bacterium]